MTPDRFRTPLSRVRGLGSARDGTRHWWMQRVTAIALVPLGLWLVVSLVGILPAGYPEAVAWLRSPLVAALVIAFVVAAFHHAQLGVQVVIEDYVPDEGVKVAALLVVKLALALLALIAVLAVLEVLLRS